MHASISAASVLCREISGTTRKKNITSYFLKNITPKQIFSALKQHVTIKSCECWFESLSCQQSYGIITALEKSCHSQCVNHVNPDGEWRRETAKQMLNVLCEILRALSEVKTTHLMIHPYHYL